MRGRKYGILRIRRTKDRFPVVPMKALIGSIIPGRVELRAVLR